MMQPSFFDHEDRLKLLERLGDPLPKLERSIAWERFRPLLTAVYKRRIKEALSQRENAGMRTM